MIPSRLERTQRLAANAASLLDLLSGYIDVRRRGETAAPTLDQLFKGPQSTIIENARKLVDQIDAAEASLLAERLGDAEMTANLIQRIVLLLIACIVLVTIVALRTTFKQIVDLKSTTDELNASLAQERALQQQLQQSQKMEAIGQLAGGIAHDFNNMLAVVMSSLTLFKRRRARGEENIDHFIDSAMEGANRAAKLTHRLLAYSRQQPLNPQPVEPNRFIADMSELLGRALGEHIRIETVLAGGLWRTYVDSSQLENSILNLSINARDAMPQGGKLTIETANAYLDENYSKFHPGIPHGQYVLIAVSDEGAGMPEEVIAKAFDPFFTTKGVGQGTGLGLSQVQGFVRQSGGHIKIYSEVGHGTTVKIYLPRYIGGGTHAPTANPAQPGAELPVGKPTEIILVVEDDERVRPVVVASLRELGYTVIHAANGQAALEILKTATSIDLLFTDIIMPDMNGRVVAEKATALYPNLKVVYTTGFSRNAIIHNGVLDAGVHFLAKPFVLEDLARKVRAVLDQQVEPDAAGRDQQ